MITKYIVAGTILTLLLVGGGHWLYGQCTQSDKYKKRGAILLSIWVVADMIGLLCAYLLGWFA